MATQEHEDRGEVQAYELAYHLVPSLSEDDLALRVTALQKAVEAAGGVPLAESYPQALTLAYRMKRLRGGRWDKYDTSFFGWMRFEAPASGIAGLETALREDDTLIRHLLFKLDKAALAPAPAPRELSGKKLEKRTVVEEKGEVSEVELDKQLEELIK